MTGAIVNFPLRNCVEIETGTVPLGDGPAQIREKVFFVTWYDEGGGSVGDYFGPSYEDACAAARDWARDGVTIIIDRTRPN